MDGRDSVRAGGDEARGQGEQGAAGSSAVRRWLAPLAVGLAALGMLVSMLGERTARPLLEDRVGPALTLLGAVIWLVGRARLRRR